MSVPDLLCGCSPQNGTFCCEGRWLLVQLRRAQEIANISGDLREYQLLLDKLHGHLAPYHQEEAG
jgi:hypothetical protein